ncbi:hypothetical protein GCM10010145_60390 [Streptomyces ruber]|uniref:Uncharacterized protein n=2 Tax=Streptomyces TaxID=1883 RepID=A0A918BRA3_9ACTN|nr:hypothetical protein [Streptomyces ruber]GGQ82693.1 hypothetical protein GCM10010145_60390 [Streptomyces ruber]
MTAQEEHGDAPEQGRDGKDEALGAEGHEAEDQAPQADAGQEPGAVGLSERGVGAGPQQSDDRQRECRPRGGHDGEEHTPHDGGAVTEARDEDTAGRDQGEVPEQAGGVAEFGHDGVTVVRGLDGDGRQERRTQGGRDSGQHCGHAPDTGLGERLGDDAGGHAGGHDGGRSTRRGDHGTRRAPSAASPVPGRSLRRVRDEVRVVHRGVSSGCGAPCSDTRQCSPFQHSDAPFRTRPLPAGAFRPHPDAGTLSG